MVGADEDVLHAEGHCSGERLDRVRVVEVDVEEWAVVGDRSWDGVSFVQEDAGYRICPHDDEGEMGAVVEDAIEGDVEDSWCALEDVLDLELECCVDLRFGLECVNAAGEGNVPRGSVFACNTEVVDVVGADHTLDCLDVFNGC